MSKSMYFSTHSCCLLFAGFMLKAGVHGVLEELFFLGSEKRKSSLTLDFLSFRIRVLTLTESRVRNHLVN